MAELYHDFETTTYNSPGLAFDPVSGLTVPGAPNPIVIPMILTSFSTPNSKPKSPVVTMVPLINQKSNLAYGGSTLFEGPVEAPKVNLEGSIDTPMTVSGSNYLSAVMIDAFRISYAEVIAMAIEGRLVASGSGYSRVNPRWFRDPYGRIYGDYNNDGSVSRPKILDFKANFMEGVPQRVSFSMTLSV